MALPSTYDQQPPFSAYDEIVEIRVGSGGDLKSFFMHKGVLCFYSGYFQGALKGNFRDTQGGVITLEAATPKVFEQFQGWVYQRRTGLEGRMGTKADSSAPHDAVKLWIFADAYLVPMLQNHVLDIYYSVFCSLWMHNSDCLKTIYNNTQAGSMLRKSAIEIVANTTEIDSLTGKTLCNLLPEEALRDVLRIVWRPSWTRWTMKYAKEVDVCGRYHVHEEGVRCNGTNKRKREEEDN